MRCHGTGEEWSIQYGATYIIQLFIRRNYWRYTSEAILNICRIRVCVCVVHDDKCEPWALSHTVAAARTMYACVCCVCVACEICCAHVFQIAATTTIHRIQTGKALAEWSHREHIRIRTRYRSIPTLPCSGQQSDREEKCELDQYILHIWAEWKRCRKNKMYMVAMYYAEHS